MTANYNSFQIVRYIDFNRVDFGKKMLIRNNAIGYTATASLVKCFVGFLHGKKPSDYFIYPDIKQYDDIEIVLDDKSICTFYDVYCRRFPDFVKPNKINQKAIDEIKELVNRVTGYIADKDIVFYDKDVFIVGNDVYTISVSIEGPTLSKLSENTAFSIRNYDANFHIDHWYIYNPRLDGEWSCCLDEVIDRRKKEEANKAAKKAKQTKAQYRFINVDAALELYKSEIEGFEFNDLFEQALSFDESLTRQRVFELVKDIRSKMDISFKDAFYLYLDDLEMGKKHGTNDILFDGKLFSSKREVYRHYFPNHTEEEIQSSIGYRTRQLNMTWEEALRATIKNPPSGRSEQIVYKGKKYKSKKVLLKVLFPKKKYESAYYSISWLMKKYNISFEEAVREYKEKDKASNSNKEVEYNGIKYRSVRSACKVLGLAPDKVFYLAKTKFNNDHKKAIDFLINNESCRK